MTEQSKRRIIGGVVLLLVASALLPFLLRDEEDLDQFYTIPPAPEFNRLEVRKLEQPAKVEEIEQKLAEVKENRLKREERQERQERKEEAVAIKKAQLQADRESNNKEAKEEKKQIRDSLDEIVFNEQGVPLRWVVQVISYVNDDARAKEFSQRLSKEGFPAMMREVTNSKQQVVYVVYVGPLLSRSKAAEYKTRLDKTYNTKSIIRSWN